MIPVRLELTNFLSYRETAVLDLEGIHLAGISGANGAGKSSIMEAITWALFGQSRVRSDDDLVNRQADDEGAAEIRFTFRLEGVTYRVIRRKRPGKTTLLELQMEAGDGAWKPLSESKLRETQAAIEDLLRMNYDTFINASFLLQGKADQFTTRTASQRKEILAELLGVTEWERYREQAAAKRKEEEGKIDLLEARLAEFANELEEEPARLDALLEAENRHQAVVDKRDLKEQLLQQARLKEAAREQQRKSIADSEIRIERLRKNLATASATLQTRHDQRRQLAERAALAGEITAAYDAWQTADQEAQAHQALAEQHNTISAAMRPFELEVAQARSRLEQQQQALTEQAAQVVVSRAEQETVTETVSEGKRQLARLETENERLGGLQEALQQARETLQQARSQRALWQQELDRLEEQARTINTAAQEKTAARKNRDEAQELITSLDERIAVINEQRQTYSGLQAEQQMLEAQQPGLRHEMDQLKERIDTLETAEAEGVCPVCDQPLSEDHRHTVIENIRADGTHFGDSYRANEKRLKALAVELPQVEKTISQGPPLENERQTQEKRLAQSEAQLLEIARKETEWSEDGEKRLVELAASLADKSVLDPQIARVAELEEALRGRPALQEELQDLRGRIMSGEARLAEIKRLLSEWDSAGKTKLADVEAQLAANDFAPEARREMVKLQEQLERTGYDAAAHQSAVEKRQAVATAPARYQALKEAQAALEPLQSAIHDLEKQIAQQDTDLKEQARQLTEAKAALAAQEVEGISLHKLQGEVNQLRQEEITAAQQVGAAQQKLKVLDDLRSLRKTLLDEKKAVSDRVQQLRVLEKACGRKGVQALLIEHALPEIEDRANELLERLTGGEMRIKFDTQKRLKSRDALAETLDIIISDRAGERPYDNYSGGEQFRINFAIRLALSQLLAKRAGARLQTLVIDEGFGSQDPQGRQRLIEAINAVQEDFACILVITHIDELREAFPTRIEVQKELNGSQISVH